MGTEMGTNEGGERSVVAFVDANIFLHFKPIQDIDWQAELEASQVLIVVDRVVLSALDKAKSQHPNSRLRDRARKRLSWLEGHLSTEPQEIRAGVTVSFHGGPVNLLSRPEFDPAWEDDRLIAAALSHAEEPWSAVLVSDDTGARLRAREMGLAATGLRGL